MKAPCTPFVLLLVFGLAAVPSPGHAQVRDLASVSIEELMDIKVTSAARKEQRAGDVAAAVFVITHEDIRRSGMTTVPDLLRLVPGVDVAQINSNKWAVSVRGFNGLFANKLLVLVDGRSVYNRLFSGVLWDAEDLMLDDVDRIEVTRGPGAAIWGANAVNGVINIVTKAAAETQGGFVRVDGGRAGEIGAVRYGGARGAASYRLYSQWTRRGESLIEAGTRAHDSSRSVTTGFRVDWATVPGAFMMEGAFTAGQTYALWPNLDPQTAAREPIANEPSDAENAHLLGRWTRQRDNGGALQLQAFFDTASRQETVGNYRRHAVDVDGQYHTTLGTRHDLVTGAGYRFIDEAFAGHVGFSLTPDDAHASLLTAFLQDEINFFGRRLAVTLGSQVQYDSDSGAGVQPTARVMWLAPLRQRVWASASRALRTPSLQDRGIRLDYPPVPGPGGLPLALTLMGNPAAQTETVVDLEGGYRAEIGAAASILVTGFAGSYQRLSTQEVGAPALQFVPSPQIGVSSTYGNQLAATTRGLEIAGHWIPVPAWRLDASYTAFRFTPHLAAASLDPLAAQSDANAPRTQWQLRSAWSPHSRATINVALFHVGPLEQLQVDAYTRADLNAEWRLTSRLSAMVIGQNLLDAAHREFAGTGSLLLPTQMARAVNVRVVWRGGAK